MTTVLIALTGAEKWTMKDGSTLPAGFWAEELIEPYRILTAAGIGIVLATPGGVSAPLQEYSLDESMTGSAGRTAELRTELAGLADRVAHPQPFAGVDPDTIDAVFVPGGTGPMEDLYDDPDLGRILGALQARTAPVATVCHGTVGLLSARSEDGWIFAGYRMTGYTDEEESQGGPGDAAPFTLESRLRAEGADFAAGTPWSEFTVTDRNLISGQNPGSAAAVARRLVTALGR
ncbi:type 1 glutamine amidotransferase domain-containing protein [Peterkaempfera bronchialis]|uniref:Type 1 glutamine amidotransferase domain-containing protein n=1 Tax=Peterkaempfera bronchialis TaxID=2126346 RepID=A0A345T4Y3_9ACTN|nr:type 1 glutamine amidotransferase domain-containing protein [Peterkaempfera bronchialis]AXI81038.1 type 1 glutamine amidotransferase domain-containing protein [Peterkaempfera bronchialis]